MYTRSEEAANAITHGIGIVLSIIGTVFLVVVAARSGDPRRVVTFAVFGLTMIVLYTASTLYHVHPDENTKKYLKRFDHISIFFLIAGTYTPIALVALRGGWGWTIFGIVWALAIAGTVFKVFFTGRFFVVSTALYVAMGWIAIIAIVPLSRSVSRETLWWILGGGLAYTGGVVFYAWKRLPFGHAVWHLFVLAGTACHYCAVISLAV